MFRIVNLLGAWGAAVVGGFMLPSAQAHDPIFGLGPHVIYQGGYEIHTSVLRERAEEERETEGELHLAYGLTGDWLVGGALPFKDVIEDSSRSTGLGDMALFTKYRFWRHDIPGGQYSAALFGKASLPTGDENERPALGSGATSGVAGLAYGYEGRRWYHWAAVRYARHDEDDDDFRQGDRVLVDLAGGYRPYQSGYYEPDTIFTLELNGEITDWAERNGRELADSGGTEVFLAPGIWWTYRNFALQTAVQIPVYGDLNGEQAATDYRAKLNLEWHY